MTKIFRDTRSMTLLTSSSSPDIVLLESSDLYKYHSTASRQADGSSKFGVDTPVSALSASLLCERGELPARVITSRTMSTLQATNSDISAPSRLGAIRSGGPIDLFTLRTIGLVLNFFLVGFLKSAFDAVLPRLLSSYMGFSNSQFNAASALLTVPWASKVFVGFLVDCVPINRQRRKPYMVIGWVLTTVFTLVLTCIKPPHPVDADESGVKTHLWDGMLYAIFATLSALSLLLPTVSAEGLMVEYAQREGDCIWGKTQCKCLLFQFLGHSVGTISMEFAVNSKAFGGKLHEDIPLQALFGICLSCALAGVLATAFLLVEERTPAGTQPFPMQLRRIWTVMQQRTTWRLALVGFLVSLAIAYEVPEFWGMFYVWLDASPLVMALSCATWYIGMALASLILLSPYRMMRWRVIVVVTTLVWLSAAVPIDMITIFNEYRSRVLYIAKAHLCHLLDGLVYALCLLMITEVAEPGYEAVTYAIMTTVFSLGRMLVTMISNSATSIFSIQSANLPLDSHDVRDHILWEFLIKYGIRLVMFPLILAYFPQRRTHLQQIRLQGNPSLVIPVVLFICFSVVFIASVTLNVLALFGATQCVTLVRSASG